MNEEIKIEGREVGEGEDGGTFEVKKKKKKTL